MRFWKRLRISGGPRADLLVVSIDDRLANVIDTGTAPHRREGVAPGLHATAEYEMARWITPVLSFGQGFRSLDAERLPPGSSRPYSTVRSVEAGLRLALPDERYITRLSAFETWVGNELVFEATSGGLERQNESIRRGLVGSIVAKPLEWFLASTAVSISDAVFATRVPGISHNVPNVPSLLVRIDTTARGRVATFDEMPVTGRIGLGYTLLAGRHLTDQLIGPANHVLNANTALRCGSIEIGIDAYNVLGLQYADDQEVYVSNWSFRPGQQPASLATHSTAAPPRTVLGTLSAYF
jgi:iron complex outermembrane recepter protein